MKILFPFQRYQLNSINIRAKSPTTMHQVKTWQCNSGQFGIHEKSNTLTEEVDHSLNDNIKEIEDKASSFAGLLQLEASHGPIVKTRCSKSIL